ncbi:hypothetical protein [Microbulbifer aestuariivivens]
MSVNYLLVSMSTRLIPIKIFLTVFFASSLYYGVLGPWYWLEFRGGIFLGSYWRDEIKNISLIYLFVNVFVSWMVLIFSRRVGDFHPEGGGRGYDVNVWTIAWALLFLGSLSAAYVFLVGRKLTEHGLLLIDDSFLLIFYQFSDLIIPALIFLVSMNCRRVKLLIFFSIIFLLYSSFTGLRYKIALYIGPLLLAFYFFPRRRQFATRAGLAVSCLIAVVFFSFMTIARSKFSGLDFDAILAAGVEDLLYGFFAETNSVFGLASVLTHYGKEWPHIYMEPLSDSVLQLIPRFIYPEKELYVYLKDIAYGISNSEEGVLSGTTTPFFGEYYAMFGWVGLISGCLIYSLLSVTLLRFVCNWSVNIKQTLIGVGLISVFMGFFYYSRGSIPQIFKVFLFVVVPYLVFVRLQSISKSFVLERKK